MLNKTTSPRIQKRGRGHLGSIKSRWCWGEGICYREEPPKHPQFLWFLHQKGVGASPPSAAGDRREQSVPMPSGTARQRLRGEQQHTRETSTSSISLPLGTKALAKSLMAWTMLTSFRRRKKKTERRRSGSGLFSTLPSYAEDAYLGFFVGDHSCPPLAGRQIEIHGVPRDGSLKPEGGEDSWAAAMSTIPIIAGCREILLMVHKSFGNRSSLPGTSDNLLIISSNWLQQGKNGWPISIFQCSDFRNIWLASFDCFITPVRKDLLI